jgi:hypothetical protein
MRNVAIVLGLVLGVMFFAVTEAHAGCYYYGTRVVNGKTWHVSLETSGTQANLWFRRVKNACSAGDFKALTLTASRKSKSSTLTLKDFAKGFCTVKRVYDNGKTAVGCASTAGAAVCLTASAPTGGTTAVLCSAAVGYSVTTGASDCVMGLAGWISSKLGAEREWNLIAYQASVASGQWSSAVSAAIDMACQGR